MRANGVGVLNRLAAMETANAKWLFECQCASRDEQSYGECEDCWQSRGMVESVSVRERPELRAVRLHRSLASDARTAQ